MSDNVKVVNIRKRNGLAGQFSVTATVQYPGEEAREVTFIGSTNGPVVLVMPGWEQSFVSRPRRFGPFGIQWVRNFFGAEESYGDE